MRRSIVISALALVAACAPAPEPAARDASAAAQPRSGYLMEGAQLSPGVRATLFGHTQGDAADLLLLVLWRGAPGWQNAPHGGGGRLPPRSEERPAGVPPGVPSPIMHDFRIGTVEFGIHFDVGSRTVRLIDEEVALGDRNVILVDRIDGAGGPPRIADVLRIDPRLPLVRQPEPEGMRSECLAISWSRGDSTEAGTPVDCEDPPPGTTLDLHALIRRAPELRAFVGTRPR